MSRFGWACGACAAGFAAALPFASTPLLTLVCVASASGLFVVWLVEFIDARDHEAPMRVDDREWRRLQRDDREWRRRWSGEGEGLS